MRTGLAILLLTFLCVFATPANVYARESFFTGISKAIKGEKEPDPSVTLRAPFIKPGDMNTPTADKMGLPYNYYDNQDTVNALAAPELNKDEVSSWLTNVISEILSTEPDKYERHLKKISVVMGPDAVNSYDSFMQESGLLNTMRDNHMQVRAFVEEEPLLLNKGVVDNRYQWLYILPATLTTLSATVQDYSSVVERDRANTRLQLRVLVVRTEAAEAIRRAGLQDAKDEFDGESDSKDGEYNFEGENDQGLVIESLEVRKNPFAK